MKKLCIFGLLLFTFSCTPPSQDADFKDFIKSFHQSKRKQFPQRAVQVGLKEFDKTLSIPNQKKHQSDLRFCKVFHDSLLRFDTSRLSVPLQFEYHKIKPFLSNYIQNLEIRKIHERDPTYYNLLEVFAPILKMKNAPAEYRLEILKNKLEKVPEYYAAAIENLKTPDPEKLQLAIDQQIQFYVFLNYRLPESFQKSTLSKTQQTNLDQLIFQARLSVKNFIAFCKSAAFEYSDESLNAIPNPSTKDQFEKVFTMKK